MGGIADLKELFSYMNFWSGLRLFADPAWLSYATLFAGCVGAAMGSFLTLITYRLPLDEPIGMKRSRCTSCGTKLRLPDLFPILSWVFTRGRCRYCKTKVHWRYPLTELATGIGTALAVWHYGVTLEALAISGLWWCIVAIVVTDLEHTIILDEVQIAVGCFAALYAYTQQTEVEDVIGAGIFGAAIGLTLKYGFIYLRNKDGLGLGDVKFLFVAGMWLASLKLFVPFLFFSGLMGIVFGMSWRAFGLGERFPFGPSLAFALLLCVVAPETTQGFFTFYGLLH